MTTFVDSYPASYRSVLRGDLDFHRERRASTALRISATHHEIENSSSHQPGSFNVLPVPQVPSWNFDVVGSFEIYATANSINRSFRIL